MRKDGDRGTSILEFTGRRLAAIVRVPVSCKQS